MAICQNAFTFTTRITNALKTDITLLELSGTAYQSGTEYSTYGPYTLKKPLNVAPGGTLSAYSEPIPAVLTQKAQGSLGLLFTTNKGLDIACFFYLLRSLASAEPSLTLFRQLLLEQQSPVT